MIEEIVRDKIREKSGLSVCEFMDLVLTHPQYGYYTQKDPLGQRGDFITAPEISQMFGETLAVCLADVYIQRFAPLQKLYLVECGAGSGILMADILRCLQKIAPSMAAIIQPVFIEINPILQAKQKQAVPQAIWADQLDEGLFVENAPVFFVGNEFLDALSFNSYIYNQKQWIERVIESDELGFVWAARSVSLPCSIPFPDNPKEGDIFEYAPDREGFISKICFFINKLNGFAIFLDYGHLQSSFGDTFQAMHRHQYCDVFDHLGQADLTSHVDFDRLSQIARQSGRHVTLSTQADFLRHYGIDMRLQQLQKGKSIAQQKRLSQDHARLTDNDQMGVLFKVMMIA
jgi:SAM-dependent MidA family methyltransferase